MINSNTNKTDVEQLVTAERVARENADNGLSSRISTLEDKHIYSHIINAIVDGQNQVFYMNLLNNISSNFTISSFVNWLKDNGYTSTTVHGKAYPIQGINATSTDYKPSIAISTDGTKIYFQTRVSGNASVQSYNISTISTFTDNVTKLL